MLLHRTLELYPGSCFLLAENVLSVWISEQNKGISPFPVAPIHVKTPMKIYFWEDPTSGNRILHYNVTYK